MGEAIGNLDPGHPTPRSMPPCHMKINIRLESRAPRRTRIAALAMRSPAAARIVSHCLAPEAIDTRPLSIKDDMDEWLERYWSLSNHASLEVLQQCFRECPVPSAPEAGKLLQRIEQAAAQLRKPPPRC